MPSIPVTRAAVINDALVRAGCLPLTAGESQHPSGPAVLLLHQLVLDSLASSYPWTFFRSTKKLERETAAPAIHWDYAYGLPADRQGMPFAIFDSADCRVPFTGFEYNDNLLLTDAQTIYCHYRKIVEPGIWPGYFRDLFTLNLAAEYALAIREDGALRAALLREAFGPPEFHGQGGRYAYATHADSTAVPSEQAGNGYDPFSSAYRSGA